MTDIQTQDSFVPTPQGRLFVRQWRPAGTADAAPIIFFHDSLGSVDQWRDFPAEVARITGRPVIAYDRLGFGRSDANPRTLAPDFIRDEARSGLAHVRDALGIDRMILAGHSVGGGMAVACAATFPDRTDAVITLAAQAFLEDRTVAGIEQARAAFRQDGQIDRLARYHGDKARWVLDAWIETWLAPSFADWTLDDDVRGLRCPILVIHGDEDEYGSTAHPRRIVAVATGPAELAIIADCHHMPHREHPNQVLDRIGAFVAAL